MIYGIENISLVAPFSLIISIILFFGVIFVGDFFQKILIKKIGIYKFLNYNLFFSPIIGIYPIILLSYFILIFEIYSIFFIKVFSFLILFLGIVNFYLNRNLYFQFIKSFRLGQSLEVHLIIILYVLLFFISASPITHADSLDYHFLGALNLIYNGHFQKEILPMHTNLVALGEIPLAIGLSLGAEQFGGIVQFSSLLSLIPVFFKQGKNKLFLLAILACPITFFLVSSPKPQLLFCVTTLLIFIFLIKNFFELKTKDIKLFFFIGLILLSVIFLSKYSFVLSAFLLFVYGYSILIRKKIIYSPIIIGLIAFIIFILPYWIFRYQNFGTNITYLLLSPLPLNIYGYENLHNLLNGGSINLISAIFSTNLKDFTLLFGPLFMFLFFMINKKTLKLKFPLIIIVTFISCVIIFGSNLSRFLYEGYLWLIFLISITYIKKSKIYSLFSKLVLAQSFLIILIYIYFVITIFPGSINENYREKIMINNANGYELAKWTNQKLDENDILISTHRSISLFNMKTFSNIFTWHIDLESKSSLKYANYLKSKKINRIVFFGNELETEPFKRCLGKQLFYKQNVGRHVGRNPFTQRKYYDGWIYEFKSEYLPSCLVK
tara:strand:- start:1039 stop:2859 length:1821 start_codon:yes stop_codon:yes gene_type:complete